MRIKEYLQEKKFTEQNAGQFTGLLNMYKGCALWVSMSYGCCLEIKWFENAYVSDKFCTTLNWKVFDKIGTSHDIACCWII